MASGIAAQLIEQAQPVLHALEHFATSAAPNIDKIIGSLQPVLNALAAGLEQAIVNGQPVAKSIADATIEHATRLASQAGPLAANAAAHAQQASLAAYEATKPHVIHAWEKGVEGATLAYASGRHLIEQAPDAAGELYAQSKHLAGQGLLALEDGIESSVQPLLRRHLGLPSNAIPSALLAQAVGALIVFAVAFTVVYALRSACGAVCCGRGRGRKAGRKDAPSTTRASSAASYVASRPGQVYVCTACEVALPGGEEPGAVERHTAGKKHAKAVAELKMKGAGGGSGRYSSPAKKGASWSSNSTSSGGVFAWVDAAKWEVSRPAPAPSPAAAASTPTASSVSRPSAVAATDYDSDPDDVITALAASKSGIKGGTGPTRRTITTKPAVAGVALHGKNVSVVYADHSSSSSSSSGSNNAGGGGGWEKVKGSTNSPSAAAAAAASASSAQVMNKLYHLEGGRNLLEGVGLMTSPFVKPSVEDAVLTMAQQAVVAAQSKRGIRRDTYVPAGADGSAAQLHYGCFVDLSSGLPVPGKLVEPLPHALAEVARKIAARGEAVGLPKGAVPDAATVLLVELGMHAPPHYGRARSNSEESSSAGLFVGPVFTVVLAGSDDLLLGLKLTPVGTSPGQYASSFALRPPRRGLVVWDGPAATDVHQAVGTLAGSQSGGGGADRLVLVEFRTMGRALKADMVARGNAV